VYENEKGKAADTAAKADVATLGMEIAVYFVDNTGAPPSITVANGQYVVAGTPVAYVGDGVELGGVEGTGADDWCVWVTNPDGLIKTFHYDVVRMGEGPC
jgi:hypothetical protein